MLVTLWNYLTGAKTEDGTWTLVSSPSPSINPPLTYDGSIDFEDAAPGTYIYKYTVSDICGVEDYSTVTIHVTSAPPIVNDECLNAISIPYSAIDGQGFLTNQNSKGDCVSFANPTVSIQALPSSWSSIEGDIWYSISAPPIGQSYTLEIKVDSSNYVPFNHANPLLALYSGSCAALQVLTVTTGSSTSGIVTVIIPDVPSITKLYLRVTSADSSWGLFDIEVRNIAATNPQETPLNCAFKTTLNEIDTYAYTKVITCGEGVPISTRSGAFNEIETVEFVADAYPKSVTVKGEGTSVDANGDFYVRFTGESLIGNINYDNMYLPTIQLATSAEVSMPGSPISLHNDTYPITEITQVGDSGDPFLEIRITGLASFEVFYLTFNF